MKKNQDNTKYEQSKEIHTFFKKMKKQTQLLLEAMEIFNNIYNDYYYPTLDIMEEKFQECFGNKKYKGNKTGYAKAYKLIQIYEKLFKQDKSKTTIEKILNRAKIKIKVKI